MYYFNWSTGKDSALALHVLLQKNNGVGMLLTTISAEHQRVSMHGVRVALLQQQAHALNLPLTIIELPSQLTMEDYEETMRKAVTVLQQQGMTCAVFGDIFLESLRESREAKLSSIGMECIFPLWKRDTRELLQEFISLKFKAIVVSAQGHLGADFVGQEIDATFLDKLPPDVDPCGENGEFHTFCYDGPIFDHAVQFTVGEKVYREYVDGDQAYGYWYCDLVPLEDSDPSLNLELEHG